MLRGVVVVGGFADLQRKWRRGLSHFTGWGAEFGRRSVAVALWRDEEEREQAQEEGWARYLGLVPAKPGLWHAAFLKINTTVFPFSSPACEPLQLLDFTTQPHTHTHTHTCLSSPISLIRFVIFCSQFSMDVSLHVMINNRQAYTFF